MRLKHFYLNAPLAAGAVATPPALAHRLATVLRLPLGAEVALFNGRDGLWRATLAASKARTLHVLEQLAPQPIPTPAPGLTLALALPKREAWDAALRQATELGVAAIQPLTSAYAQVGRVQADKARAHLVEAAEQCERLTLPTLHPVQPLAAWLAQQTSPILWAYERGTPAGNAALHGCMSVLVGPEGGFSPAEIELLNNHPHVRPCTLPTPILRTDTAVVAALTAAIVQQTMPPPTGGGKVRH